MDSTNAGIMDDVDVEILDNFIETEKTKLADLQKKYLRVLKKEPKIVAKKKPEALKIKKEMVKIQIKVEKEIKDRKNITSITEHRLNHQSII